MAFKTNTIEIKLKRREQLYKQISFLDLHIAFNSVDNNILFNKLFVYVITGIALEWFESYLNNFLQKVKISFTNPSKYYTKLLLNFIKS